MIHSELNERTHPQPTPQVSPNSLLTESQNGTNSQEFPASVVHGNLWAIQQLVVKPIIFRYLLTWLLNSLEDPPILLQY